MHASYAIPYSTSPSSAKGHDPEYTFSCISAEPGLVNADADSTDPGVCPEPKTVAKTRGVRVLTPTGTSSGELKSKPVRAWSRAGVIVGHNEEGVSVGNFEVGNLNGSELGELLFSLPQP